MHFDQGLINQKIRHMLALQNDPNYRPAKPIAKTYKCKIDPEKAKERTEKKEARERLKKEAEARKEAAQQAKGIIQARKIKRLEEQEGIKAKTDYSFRDKSHSREKPLPTRPLNLEEKIPVRIDRKTIVYANPGADIEAIKAKYKREPLKIEEANVPAKKSSKNEAVDNDQVKKLVAMEISVKQIAKMLNVRPSSVKKIMKYQGIK